MLTDIYNRSFKYLRLSITDLCNFNCRYCMPNNIILKKKKYLSIDEIYNLTSFLSELGIQKIRLTGGEPTIRKDFISIGKIINEFSNIKSLVFTTNGYRLENIAYDAFKVGFKGVNVSLDTLNKLKFYSITGKNCFEKIYTGIFTALSVGLKVKINVVLSNFFTFDDFEDFYFLIKYKNITVRFIDQMILNNNITLNKSLITSKQIYKFLINNGWIHEKKNFLDGPAIILKNEKFLGHIGLINPYSEKFCNSCNRIRISALGDLFLCLFDNSKYYIRNYLNSINKKNDFKIFLIEKLKLKVKSHQIFKKKFGILNSFSSIGG